MKKLIKSYKFWTAFAGAMGILLVAIGNMAGITINADGVEEIIMSICGLLVVFGIVTKPKDDEQDENNESINETQTETEKKEDKK